MWEHKVLALFYRLVRFLSISHLKWFFRFLDISQVIDKYGIFISPKAVLSSIVTNLPNLTGLDISGTNLTSPDFFEIDDTIKEKVMINLNVIILKF